MEQLDQAQGVTQGSRLTPVSGAKANQRRKEKEKKKEVAKAR